MQNHVSSLKNNLYMLKTLWGIRPDRVIMTFVMTILSFASWTFYTVFFMKYLFESNMQGHLFSEVLTFIWFAVVINLFYYILQSWYNHKYVPLTNADIQFSLNKMLFQKAIEVDLSCYDNPDFYNSYTKAAHEAYDRFISALNTCANIFSSFCSSVYVIYIMCRITPLALPFIILPLIGNLYFGKKTSKIEYQIDCESTPYKRRQEYVNRVFYLKKYAGEIRMTSIFSIMQEIYDVAVNGIICVSKNFANKYFVNRFAQNMLIFPLAFQGTWFLACYLAIVTKTITLSDFIVLSSSIVSITWMGKNFTDSIIQFFFDANFIENFKVFLAYKPKLDENQIGQTPPKKVFTLEFRNVSYQYEGQKKYALKNLNLVLYSGTKTMIVGVNGAGKSTLFKLLMRLYDPTDGEILLNGINIKEYDIKKYREIIGVAFQDFALFSATIVDNVIMRDLITDKDRANAVASLKKSGLYDKILTLEKRENAILTREFDDAGVELSGGEKQKIAIARAFAKDGAIVLLDEPSAALDPVAEYNMYESIMDLCNEQGNEKIVIMVTHRLSLANLYDKVILLENGMIVEEGTHNDLMRQDGVYAKIYRLQSKNYLQSEKDK